MNPRDFSRGESQIYPNNDTSHNCDAFNRHSDGTSIRDTHPRGNTKKTQVSQ